MSWLPDVRVLLVYNRLTRLKILSDVRNFPSSLLLFFFLISISSYVLSLAVLQWMPSQFQSGTLGHFVRHHPEGNRTTSHSFAYIRRYKKVSAFVPPLSLFTYSWLGRRGFITLFTSVFYVLPVCAVYSRRLFCEIFHSVCSCLFFYVLLFTQAILWCRQETFCLWKPLHQWFSTEVWVPLGVYSRSI